VFLQDLRYAARTLRNSPGVTAIAVVSLALGIGANTAIFSVVNALLLQPLPYPESDRLAALWLRVPGNNVTQDWPSPSQYFEVREQQSSFEEMSISRGGPGTLVTADRPENVDVLRTSSALFRLLGARPLMGRLFLAEEDRPGRPDVAILSHATWRRLFHSDPSVVGKTIRIGAASMQVIGVLRPEFLMDHEVMPTVGSTAAIDIFLPLAFPADVARLRGEDYNVLGRLKPGVTMEQAYADVALIAARIRDREKRDRTFTIAVTPLLEQIVGDARRPVLVLFGSVALVLLIACANVANLLLARAGGRQKEIAIRTALGASWTRLSRQFLAESVLLGVAGGVAGLLVAQASLAVVVAVNPGNIPRLESIRIDGGVLAFTLLVSLLTGVVFGIAPALRAVKVDLQTSLKAGGRTSSGGAGGSISRHRLRSLLVVFELAFSIVLLVGAGLLIRSFARLQEVSPGFRPDHVISMRLGAPGRSFANNDAVFAAVSDLFGRVSAVPGVTAAGAVSALPFTTAASWDVIHAEGFTPPPGQQVQVDMRGVTADYFQTMGIPLRQGRFFQPEERSGRAIVDERFAERFWPGQNPIGKQIWLDPERKLTVVGVVGNVKQYSLDVEGRAAMYMPSGNPRYLVARTAGDPTAAAAAIVRAVQAVEGARPVYNIRTIETRMRDSMARQRFSAVMLGAFAAFALILAAVGVYGVISCVVEQGTHDLGVRIALGAQRRDILTLVARQAMTLALAGIAAGTAGALLLTRAVAGMLFGVSATDAATFSAAPVVLAAVAALASYVPARRAARVDPIMALRGE
jgi:predicted permease